MTSSSASSRSAAVISGPSSHSSVRYPVPECWTEGTRSNLRFADKRIAGLEVQLLERAPPT